MIKSKEQRIMFWLIAIGILVVLITSIVQLSGSENISGDQKILQIQENDIVKGPEDAAVTIIEYSDFQCPFCKISSGYFDQLAQDFPNDVRIVYRYFPLRSIHPGAYPAALAAEAAHAQGKFWEMHDLLFAKQEQWSRVANTNDLFIGYAEEIGLDGEKFRTDLLNKVGKEKVDQDLASATNLGLRGTPSIFINGEQFQNLRNYEDLKQEIEKYVQ